MIVYEFSRIGLAQESSKRRFVYRYSYFVGIGLRKISSTFRADGVCVGKSLRNFIILFAWAIYFEREFIVTRYYFSRYNFGIFFYRNVFFSGKGFEYNIFLL